MTLIGNEKLLESANRRVVSSLRSLTTSAKVYKSSSSGRNDREPESHQEPAQAEAADHK